MTIHRRLANTTLFLIVIGFSIDTFANYQEVPAIEKELDINVNDLDKLMRDQAILNQMNDIDGSIDLLELDKQDTLLDLNNEVPAIGEDYELIDDEFLLDDNFDDLDLELDLFEEEIEAEQLSPRDIPLKFKGNKTIKLPNSKPSVGIQGAEEQLINQLDKSDLMNIEEDLESWLDPVNSVPELQDNIEIIDDIDDIE